MTLNPYSDLRRPSLRLLTSEPLRATWEYLRHRVRHAVATRVDRGHPVIIFPGFLTNDRFVAPLHEHCRALGHEVIDWGRGYNFGPRGDLATWLQELAAHTLTLLRSANEKPTLIGWSLGGLYAREMAKLLPNRVRQVVTIGSPFAATADHTNVGWLFRMLGGSSAAFESAMTERLRTAPDVPTTSIYSQQDGVVAWQSCLQNAEVQNDRAKNGGHCRCQDIEVRGSHLGMPWNPAVLRIIEDRLRTLPEQWEPFLH